MTELSCRAGSRGGMCTALVQNREGDRTSRATCLSEAGTHVPRLCGCWDKDQSNRTENAGASANSTRPDFAEGKEPRAAPLCCPESPRSAVWGGQAGSSDDPGRHRAGFLRVSTAPAHTPPARLPNPSHGCCGLLRSWTAHYRVWTRGEFETSKKNCHQPRPHKGNRSGRPGFGGVSREATGRITKRKHAELPGAPAANNSVLLTTKVRDRDKGTEKWRKTG